MSPMPEVAELLRVVCVDDVRRYLTGRGWQVVASRNPDVLRFAGRMAASGAPIVAVIPVSEDFDDYAVRVWELISLLSTLEGRPAREVLRDIVLSGSPAPAAEAPEPDERVSEGQPVAASSMHGTGQPPAQRTLRAEPVQRREPRGPRMSIDLAQFTGLRRLSAFPGGTVSTVRLQRSRPSATAERLSDLIVCNLGTDEEWRVIVPNLAELVRRAIMR